MNEIGPFVALGRPGEGLPEVGAYRKYTGPDKWQQEVIDLFSAAQLVVIRLGMTKGLAWELSTAVKLVEPMQLLLLVPCKLHYDEFRREWASLFPAGLPESLGLRWFTGPGVMSIRGVISFSSNWTPSFIELHLSLLYSGTTPLKASLKIALAPVINRLGLHFQPLTFPWVFWIPLPVLFFLLVCIEFAALQR